MFDVVDPFTQAPIGLQSTLHRNIRALLPLPCNSLLAQFDACWRNVRKDAHLFLLQKPKLFSSKTIFAPFHPFGAGRQVESLAQLFDPGELYKWKLEEFSLGHFVRIIVRKIQIAWQFFRISRRFNNKRFG